MTWPLRVISVCLLLVGCIAAQQSGQASASPTNRGDSSSRDNEGHSRIFGVVPAFEVTNEKNAPPMAPHDKFQLFARSSYDPFTFVAAGFQAGLSQAADEFNEYGQGAAGYGKRYGAALADSVSSNFFADFAYPVLLKQDPRYYRVGSGTAEHRIIYSLAQVVRSKRDNGKWTFNAPSVLAALTTGSIANAYYPPSDRGFGLTMSRAAISLGYGAAGGLAKEFWPDIDRWLFHRKGK